MLHNVPTEELGPHGESMAKAVQTCVHCGFCLPACPTYLEMGQEMDSPRGRIILMKEVLEGTVPLEQAQPHIDRCLGCLACEPACPSGVPYRDLISPFRAMAEPKRARTLTEKLQRLAIRNTLPYPSRFRLASKMAGLAKPMAGMLPSGMRAMLDLSPTSLPPKQTFPSVIPAEGKQRGRVALLIGCAQSVLEPGINAATIQLLTTNGVEVVIPDKQRCCGALSWHVGDQPQAAKFAQQNIEAFPDDVDAVITNAAGCGSGIHEYPLILKGTEWEEKARLMAERTLDITVYLHQLGLRTSFRLAEPTKVAYQDACHLKNAQGVSAPPRALLESVENLELVEIPDAALCCGSAGVYNIEQPDTAAALGQRKVEAILRTGAGVIASGNIGCLTQMKHHAQEHPELQFKHTVELLAEALRFRAS